MSNEHVNQIFQPVFDALAKTDAVLDAAGIPKEPPYPFCHHAEKCIAAGRCARTVKDEPWCCND